jgi:hypothetical protein
MNKTLFWIYINLKTLKMKKIFFLLAISFGMLVSAQKHHSKSHEKHHEKHHEDKKNHIHHFEKMTHEEKMAFIQQLNINKITKELELSGEKKEAVEKVLSEYFTAKGDIIKNFKPEDTHKNLTDEEALRKINLGFEVAQKVLDNRKFYSKKLLEILSPQQVLKIYKIEKDIKNSFKHKHDKDKHKTK